MYLLQAMAVTTQENRNLKIAAVQLCFLKQGNKTKLNQNFCKTSIGGEHKANQALSDLAWDF